MHTKKKHIGINEMKVIGRLGTVLLPDPACLDSAKTCSPKVNADKTHENMNGVAIWLRIASSLT